MPHPIDSDSATSRMEETRQQELVGREVMAEFREGEEKRMRQKAERVAPMIERAMKRKKQPRIPKTSGPTIVKASGGYGGIIPGVTDQKA